VKLEWTDEVKSAEGLVRAEVKLTQIQPVSFADRQTVRQDAVARIRTGGKYFACNAGL